MQSERTSVTVSQGDSKIMAGTMSIEFKLRFKNVTYAVLRKLRDVVEDDLVRVARRVLSVLVTVESDGADDSRLGVLERSVTTEVSSLLLICVLFCHSSTFWRGFISNKDLNYKSDLFS